MYVGIVISKTLFEKLHLNRPVNFYKTVKEENLFLNVNTKHYENSIIILILVCVYVKN